MERRPIPGQSVLEPMEKSTKMARVEAEFRSQRSCDDKGRQSPKKPMETGKGYRNPYECRRSSKERKGAHSGFHVIS